MTLSGLLAQTAAGSPDHVGLVDVDRSWTYAELAADVGRLTRVLADNGVQPGDRVGVHMLKSAEGTIAMHAVVAAGAVAVPLDPTSPAERLARVCRRITISTVLSHDPRRSGIEELARLHPIELVIGVDGPIGDVGTVIGTAQVAANEPVAAVPVQLDDWAYIITTSGSTGEPKGIVHTHRSALAYAQASVNAFDVSPSDRIADIAPHHFDQSTFALWSGPLAGATLVVMPEPYQRLPASLSTRIQDERITIWYSVPFLLQQFITRGDLDNRDLSNLRLVKFGGEVPSGPVLDQLAALAPHAAMVNIYGPAELNQCTHHALTAADRRAPIVPIGRPWPESEVRVVEVGGTTPDLPQVGSGELWVASETMMAGYFAEPELDTRSIEEFDGCRWYRTGDLVEWVDDVLVFLGRRDQQVKVRGHRIEIEAVEAELERVDGVESVVIGVHRREDATDVLVAGLIPAGAAETDLVDEIRRHARDKLPAWSLPAQILTLRGIKTTGSGKLDRQALRAQLLSMIEES